MVIPSGVLIALSTAVRNCSAPPDRKARSPIELRIDLVESKSLADRTKASALLNHLHVIIVIGALAVDCDTDPGLLICKNSRHQGLGDEGIAVPNETIP